MNKKKFFGIVTVLAIAVITAFNVNINSQEKGLSDVYLANIEALAYELPEVVVSCDSQPGLINGGGLGQCWENKASFWQEFWGGKKCEFSGRMNDHCWYNNPYF